MSKFTIKTSRLVFRKITAEDAGKYYLLSNNPRVMKFVTGHALSRDQSDDMLRSFLLENEEQEYLGRYLVEGRKNNELIGIAKLDRIEDTIEIGYRVQEEFWGKGIATEIASALIRFARKKIGAKTVVAFVNVENAASVRVLEKAGMTNIQTISDIDEVKYKYIYSPKTAAIVKKVLYVILGLIAIFLVAALIMPKDYAVEREITINKPRSEVFAYLKPLKNQDNWSVWMSKDPNIKKSFKGTDGNVGFTSMWEGNSEVGKGEQEIKKIVEEERIDTELRFIDPFESTNSAYMITEDAGLGQTKVKWGFSGQMPYPMNAMMPLMGMETSVGKDFADGLANLKGILEK